MPKTGGLSQARLGRISEALHAHVGPAGVAGFVALVARDDAVRVVAGGVQDLETAVPMRRDTIFRIASMTKPAVAVAAMILVEEGRLRLDEPVDRLLPELVDRRVLRTLGSALDDTVPASRPMTLRDLMTFRCGFGAVIARPGTYPIQQVMADAGFAPGPVPSVLTPDTWIADFARMPLIRQPGEAWLYHTGSDILAVLVARAAGAPLPDFMAERIFSPLGMTDTGFHVQPDKIDRLATSYRVDGDHLTVFDKAKDGIWSKPPVFASGGGGLVSTADDYLAFCRMMLGNGAYGGVRILSRPSVELMTNDHLTPEQKAVSPFYPGFWDSNGWGFGMAVTTRRDGYLSPGSFGWDGGFGTSARTDPKEGLTTILLTQRMLRSPAPEDIVVDFRTLAYQAIDD